MKRSLIFLFFVLSIAAHSLSIAQDFKDIGADQLKKMIEGKTAVVVDARTEDEFRQGHIKGAINIPPEKLTGIAGLLPKNKKQALVFYCRGTG